METKSNTTRQKGLQVGDVFERDGKEFVCWWLNESRACVTPLSARIEYKTDDDGKIKFIAAESENVSPNSEVDITRSLGRKGLAEYLDKRSKKGNNVSDNKEKKSKKEKKNGEAKTRAGKLGGWKGHSITSVIRALGKAGWTLEEARVWLKSERIEAADNTIKIQLRRGKIGENEPAKLGSDMPTKPKVEKKEKPAKAEKKSKKDKGGKSAKKKNGKKKKHKADKEGENGADVPAEEEEEGAEEEEAA